MKILLVDTSKGYKYELTGTTNAIVFELKSKRAFKTTTACFRAMVRHAEKLGVIMPTLKKIEEQCYMVRR